VVLTILCCSEQEDSSEEEEEDEDRGLSFLLARYYFLETTYFLFLLPSDLFDYSEESELEESSRFAFLDPLLS
jgi:hypothetical protein